MSWEAKPLREILDQSGRDRAGNQDLPVLSITMRHGLVDQAEKFKKRVASSDTSSYRIAYKNELVVGFPIDEGVIGFQTKYPAGIVSPAYDVWRLKNAGGCHIPYLERYLRSSQARSLYALRMQGAVARRRSLTKADFLALEVPFPSLDHQIRIAHLLGKVEGLISKRKLRLQQLDDLLKSAFLEMFGDPVVNPKRWPNLGLGAALTFMQYGPRFYNESYSAEGTRIVRITDLNENGDLDFLAMPKLTVTEEERKKFLLQPGDLIFARTGATVGKVALIGPNDPPAIAGAYFIVMRFKKTLAPLYVRSVLTSKSVRAIIGERSRQAAQPNFSGPGLRQLPMPIPPMELQQEFAELSDKVANLRAHYQHSLTDLEVLYGALCQQAFKGELDLSRVCMPDTQPEKAKTVILKSFHTHAEQGLAINLPDTDNLLGALENV
ncbi:restriction endonuclease subunit S [Massilia sp. R2A-15]|uniref:restriction endonuclease subunit S n=1 Tax=Massilia sp. R2A-15 TaxID=3064278 RepID=UPI00273467E2|nr:restriction endonuclease subunit S [Massilia sp. R2A-15]WLI89246.1 restriction endonuclease subunit S [Massilia sp. R2A-15]